MFEWVCCDYIPITKVEHDVYRLHEGLGFFILMFIIHWLYYCKHQFIAFLRTGTLLKSNSFNTFNSKPKVKLVDEVPQNQKCSREGRSPDVKVGTARMISKSMSFRSMNSGRSNATESKVKMLSSKYSQAQDVKALKQAKERNAFESKSSSKLDRPIGSSLTTSSNVCVSKVGQKLTPRGDSVMSSSTSNNKESNTSQSDGKLGSSSRSISSIAHKGAEIPVTSGMFLPS